MTSLKKQNNIHNGDLKTAIFRNNTYFDRETGRWVVKRVIDDVRRINFEENWKKKNTIMEEGSDYQLMQDPQMQKLVIMYLALCVAIILFFSLNCHVKLYRMITCKR